MAALFPQVMKYTQGNSNGKQGPGEETAEQSKAWGQDWVESKARLPQETDMTMVTGFMPVFSDHDMRLPAANAAGSGEKASLPADCGS